VSSRARKKAKARAANEPGRHHYVPAGYIGLFADPPGRQGAINVWDNRRWKSWKSKPEHVAHLEDFYRIEGDEPLVVEKVLREVEGSAIRVIKALDREERKPTQPEVEALLDFVALQIIRGPGLRAEFERFVTDALRLTLEMRTRSEAAWETSMRDLEAADPSFKQEDAPSREDVLEMVRGDEIQINVNRGWLVTGTLGVHETVHRILRARHLWFLRVEGPEDLLTGSSPVVLTPHPDHPQGLVGVAPGTAAVISMPLTPRLLFEARDYEHEPGRTFFTAPPAMVNALNLYLAGQSEQVYSRVEFRPPAWATPPNQTGSGS
jgi:hypothetical protein